MTIQEAISQVKKSLREVTTDSRLTNKLVYSKLLSTASLLIQRESDALKLSEQSNLFQPYKCVDWQEVDAADRNCFGLTSRAKLYRTLRPVPAIYEDSDGPIVRRIISVDNHTAIKRVPKDTIRRLKGDTNSKYDKTVYAFFSDGYIYLTEEVPVEIDAYFKGELPAFCPDCVDTDNPCLPFLENPFRIPAKTEDAIISKVIQDIANSYKRIPEDPTTNKSQNT
jgi:hypothetical protein